MKIYCEDLHNYKEKIDSGEEPDMFLEELESAEAFRKHEEEIKLAVSKYKRVYLIVSTDFKVSGVFKAPNREQLMKSLKKSDGFAQNAMVCKLMACNLTEDSTLKMVNEVIADKRENVPSTLILSIGNILLDKEGIGIIEAGK